MKREFGGCFRTFALQTCDCQAWVQNNYTCMISAPDVGRTKDSGQVIGGYSLCHRSVTSHHISGHRK